jgi:predicted HicB family RNase H-like nuclease
MKDLIHYKDYYGSVHFDEEALVFHGKVEFVRALITYEATNAKGLKKAFEASVDDYLHLCKTQKISPELPFKGSLNVRLGANLHRRVAIAAERFNLTINKFIAESLDKAVESVK